MTTHLGLQRILLPSAQVSTLTTGSITLPSARGQAVEYANNYDYELISTTTISNGDSSTTWLSLPSTRTGYTIEYTGNFSAATNLMLRFNGDTGNNYDYGYYRGTTASGKTVNQSGGQVGYSGSSRQVTGRIDIYGCDNTDGNATAFHRGSAINESFTHGFMMWKNTAAVSSMTLYTTGGTWATTGYIFLYGWKR